MPGLEAEVRVGGSWTRVVCLHLFPPVGKHRKSDGFLQTLAKNANLREQQAAAIVRRYKRFRGPLLLIGDMNEEAKHKAMQTFQKAAFVRACDAAADSSCGPTWPADRSPLPALFEIDHILGRNVTFLTARVVLEGSSDHHPVLATFSLRQAKKR
jgi:endonuclease/exonuclease/phosphatase (EEP) superfamily protein YafD